MIRLQKAVLDTLGDIHWPKEMDADILAFVLTTGPSWLAGSEQLLELGERVSNLIDGRAAGLAARFGSAFNVLDVKGRAGFDYQGLKFNILKRHQVLAIRLEDARGREVVGVLGTQWAERLTRAAMGSCGLAQVPGDLELSLPTNERRTCETSVSRLFRNSHPKLRIVKKNGYNAPYQQYSTIRV